MTREERDFVRSEGAPQSPGEIWRELRVRLLLWFIGGESEGRREEAKETPPSPVQKEPDTSD